MAVGANTYGSVEGVEKLVGDLVSGREFGASTVPTETQVESVLDDVAMDINRELEAASFTVPVDSDDYPTAHGFVAALNNYGAASIVLSMLPTGAYQPEEDFEGGGTSRAEMFSKRYNSGLKKIRESKFKAGRDRERLAFMKFGGRTDSSGDKKLPFFTRTLHEYPGVRDLTAEED